MMPDLGKYAASVLTSYAASIALLALLVAITFWRGRKARQALDAVEHRNRKTDG